MSKVEIVGVPPWDGMYPLDNEFTNGEFHLIKEISGVRAGEIAEEAGRGNNDLIVAMAAVALKQNGKDVLVDDLWNAKAGKIIFHADPDEVEEEDPPLTPPIALVSSDVENSSSDPSGSGSERFTEIPAESLPATGEAG